jgi:hypothetical protein
MFLHRGCFAHFIVEIVALDLYQEITSVTVFLNIMENRAALMAIPRKLFLLSSVAVSWFTFRHAPYYTLSESFVLNSLAFLFLGLLPSFCWATFVYPLLLSPLRNLPQPPVSLIMRLVSIFSH